MVLGVVLPWSTKATSPFDAYCCSTLFESPGWYPSQGFTELPVEYSTIHFKDNSSACIQLTRTRDQEERSPRVRTSFPIVQTLSPVLALKYVNPPFVVTAWEQRVVYEIRPYILLCYVEVFVNVSNNSK